MSRSATRDWGATWAKPNTAALSAATQSTRQRRALIAIAAWPLILTLLQGTVLNPSLVERALRAIPGIGQVADYGDEPQIEGVATEGEKEPGEQDRGVERGPDVIQVPGGQDVGTTPPGDPGTTTIPRADLTLTGPGTATTSVVTRADLLPGTSSSSAALLTNAGDLALGEVVLMTSASPSSILTTDAADGLRISVRTCSVDWAGTTARPTCAGTESPATTTPLARAEEVPLAFTAGEPGQRRNLLVTLSLPESAGNDFQGLSTTVTYSLRATAVGSN